jgi:RimJ/RimL family protein N-acetyltransferase
MILKEFNSPSGKKIIIRKAVHADAENIIAYSTHILSTFTQFVLTTPEEFNPSLEDQKKWIDNLNGPASFLALAETDSKMVGLIHFETGKKKKASHVGEFAISVREGYHDQKIGSEMLKCLIAWAKENPAVEKIILNVNSVNEKAIHLYKKLGFEIEGHNKKAVKQPDGSYIDNIQMALFV